MSGGKKISASAMAKSLDRTNQDVVKELLGGGMILRDNGVWQLTAKGESFGGEYRESARFGRFIVWPDDLLAQRADAQLAQVGRISGSRSSGQATKPRARGPMLTSTKLGALFELSPNRMNKLLAEIGWIEKGLKGWHVTPSGLRVDGLEKEHGSSGVPFVVWPECIAENAVLVENIDDFAGALADEADAETPAKSALRPPPSVEAQQVAAFRQKFEAKYRATDGHYVRSRAELAIDNWLYMSSLVHAYERKLPIEEDAYCDFYLPNGKVYVEFWGMEDDPQYAHRKTKKLKLYGKYGYKLIELTNEDILSLDDVMPRKLLKFGIKAE